MRPAAPAAPAHVLQVLTQQGTAGRLTRDGSYLFSFDPQANANSAPALSMPLRPRAYEHPVLHPIFQMNLPEGYVLEQLRLRLAKTSGMDPLLILSVIGSHAPIGRLRFCLEDGTSMEHLLSEPTHPRGESLAALLACQGSADLFARLVETYLLRSGLSGVQPKVLVPQVPAESGLLHPGLRASLPTDDLIVKSGLGEYPGLAINEFVCMSIVKRCGVAVPDFFLSEDGGLFIMRRFDRPPTGEVLGFEDLVVVAGRSPAQKYEGSYEMALRLLAMVCSPAALPAARQQLFDMVALSCILGNGDAHLKNFGVIYPSTQGSVSMAPAFDIVCTTYYLPDDTLALTLDGSKSFFRARLGLIALGLACGMPERKAKARVGQLMTTALKVLGELEPVASRLPGLGQAIQAQTKMFVSGFA